MLSVIVDAAGSEADLPILLSTLTPAAMDGVVRDVVIAAPAVTPLIAALCEETGAEVALGGLAAAAGVARYDRLLLLPAGLRLRSGWIASLKEHLARGGGAARLFGERAGVLRAGPYGVLVAKAQVAALAHSDLKRLGRQLGPGAARIG
jgi:hypothetical protein